MTPDKIYIPQHNIEAGTIQELGELIIEGSVEYIRKDTLLEWLEGKMTREEATEGFVGGYDIALKDVIKHIEALG